MKLIKLLKYIIICITFFIFIITSSSYYSYYKSDDMYYIKPEFNIINIYTYKTNKYAYVENQFGQFNILLTGMNYKIQNTNIIFEDKIHYDFFKSHSIYNNINYDNIKNNIKNKKNLFLYMHHNILNLFIIYNIIYSCSFILSYIYYKCIK